MEYLKYNNNNNNNNNANTGLREMSVYERVYRCRYNGIYVRVYGHIVRGYMLIRVHVYFNIIAGEML